MSTHLRADGTWRACRYPAECKLFFHFDLGAPELSLLPMHVIYPLLEVIDPPNEVDEAGLKLWSNDVGELHRDYDLPAAIYPNGNCGWYANGVLHRAGDKPALMAASGTQIWYTHGVKGRTGGKPAATLGDGGQRWFNQGLLHRVDGPAVIFPDGSASWYLNGQQLTETAHRLRTQA